MKAFANLYRDLDESNRTNDKVAALAAYLRVAAPADAAWAIHFLIGKRPKRPVNTTKLTEWARDTSGLSSWLFQESYDAVGDLAETLAVLVPPADLIAPDRPLAAVVETYILGLTGQPEEVQREAIVALWREQSTLERFVFNKLITGAFRVGVSQELVVRAIAEVSGRTKNVIAHRIMGNTVPSAGWVDGLYAEVAPESDADASQPFPFCLAHPLESGPQTLGDREGWCAEWKWDGLRAQVIRRGETVAVWSRGEELMTTRFPEIADLARRLPEGTVLDGELLGWSEGRPLRFAELQRRIGRKVLGKKILEEVPVALIAFDLLECAGDDLRDLPLRERRTRLAALFVPEGEGSARPDPALGLTPVDRHLLLANSLSGTWEELAAQRAVAREFGTEGLMLKGWETPYETGRRRGVWWKWKIEPMTVDAVMIYAQRGSGKRASLYSDYTFAVWDGSPEAGGTLVPFAKAYSGLTDAELARVDHWVRRNTQETFGPVRSVTPTLVMELGFEGIALSSRHKSGIAVRFPRILRWREDKTPADADTLETVKALIRAEG
ncbi:MAG: ATP-dependent DNA ligase [Chloroflexota bacterium]